IQMHKTSDWLHVPLNLEALSVLNKRLGSTTKENDFIFPEYQSEKQRRQCRWQLQSMFEREKVRENRIALHTFRHTYAHQMLANGMPKEVLQTFLGHRSVRTTEIYANWVTQNELRKWI
ncbi:MAG: tyrosine-type recombinase/integrase, partial [Bacteroidetes bacterium]|nr:tyrosine-type recombinase/integrase [Bacteroidota bacterium]